MNLNQIINLLMRLFGRRLLNGAIFRGIELAARKGKPAEQMTEAERSAAGTMRQAVKRVQDAMRITRRF
ncbi:hypothetical protein [Paenirhodobacter enshiensis]|uniref:hypothetical protein n=1 Tax=Paenirhodobacter enshiensis TaxID=1105367 RepID=UPI0035ADD74A